MPTPVEVIHASLDGKQNVLALQARVTTSSQAQAQSSPQIGEVSELRKFVVQHLAPVASKDVEAKQKDLKAKAFDGCLQYIDRHGLRGFYVFPE